MHPSSLHEMRLFIEKYLAGKTHLQVLDVGSLDMNGTYCGLCDEYPGIISGYIGLDIVEGPNVDLVAQDPNSYDQVGDNSFDVVISGQSFEHMENDAAIMKEIARIVKPGGHVCVIAPSNGPKHGNHDYRRYQPSDMATIAEGAGLTVIECKVDGRRPWFDCVLIAMKPEEEKPKKKKAEK